jgi:radical SAM protein with 4Fe4S-binding SPASM domain
MKLSDFKSIVDDNNFRKIFFNFAGEPLLNKDIFKMVRYASDNGIWTMISTNSTMLHKYKCDEILSSGLDMLTVCVDGADKKTHETYRRGSDFDRIINNIRTLCEAKSEAGKDRPKIELQFIVMKHNEHQMNDIRRLGKQLGVDTVKFKTVNIGLSFNGAERRILIDRFAPLNEKYRRYYKDYTLKHKGICTWLRSSVIYWNGDVTLCCWDYDGKLVVGNVFEDGGFMKVYNSEKYKRYRKKAIRREFSLCKKCGAGVVL